MSTTTNAELIACLMPTFLAELAQRTAALAENLRRFEAGSNGDARASLLRDVAREAHSLKGASRSVQERGVELACERLELFLGGKAAAGSVSVRDEDAIAALREVIAVMGEAELRLTAN